MRFSRIVPLLACGLLGLSSLRADVVILKDGTTLHGKLRQDTELIFEKGSGVIPVSKGFHFVDDDVRKIAFSFQLIPNADAIDPKDMLKGPGVEIIQNNVVRLNSLKIDNGLGTITQITPWNEKWERSLTFLTSRGPETVKQKIWVMTPHAVLIQADRYRWVASYLTKELGVEQIRKLLYDHPDLRDKNGVADPARRMRIFRFLMQAGWYEEAGRELDQLLKDAPAEKMRVDEARKTLKSFQAQHDFEELLQGQKAGRHEWVLKGLKSFPKEAASERLLLQFQTLQRQYEDAQEAIAAARRYLKALLAMVSPDEHRKVFADAVDAILAELNFDNHDRLEAFLKHAKQAEALQSKGQVATDGPNELLALAVSGWLLGNSLADPEVPGAIKLWKVRQQIRELQKTHQEAGRQALLVQIERLRVPFDLVALIIRSLPPPEPEATLPGPASELQTKLPGRAQPISYLLNLPREYHPGRPYPVFFVLNDGNASPADTLGYWAEQAEKNGYILVAVDRTNGGKRPAHSYSAEEHALVLDTLRDLQNRFNVDTDRVFLTGTGEGAAMAYDVGLSHPDRFAGVIPICGLPRLFTMAYSSNGQHLPFYVVCGDLAPPDYTKAIRRQFETWTTRAHPSLYIEYRGRGMEWYNGELPYLFAWMSRKTRDNAVPDTGEFCSMRFSDNRFYWLSGEGMDPRHINNAANWSNTVRPATLWGKINANNQVSVMSKGYKQVSIWLGPGMLDWKGKVSVSINTNSRIRDRELTPSLATMLEDFYQRGDRQRLFFLKLDLAP